MEWREKLQRWLSPGPGPGPAELAKRVGVSARTVQRWLTGETIPDEATQGRLTALGAPVPGKTVRPRPAASSRIEDQLARIEKKLDRLLAQDRGDPGRAGA